VPTVSQYFFSSEVWQIFCLHKQGFFDKIFLFIFCGQNFAKIFQREKVLLSTEQIKNYTQIQYFGTFDL
jgi:hypothetical protein